MLAELDATELKYWHRKMDKDRHYAYVLTAVDGKGRESKPVYATVL